MPKLQPRFITFDCYGTLTRFQISDLAREMFANRIPAETPGAVRAGLHLLSPRRGTRRLEAL